MLTTGANRTWVSAPAEAFTAAPVAGGRSPRLQDDPGGASRFRRACDRAKVARVLDAVQHDEQRRRFPPHEIGHGVLNRTPYRRDHALVNATTRQSVEFSGRYPMHRHVATRGQRTQLSRPPCAAGTEVYLSHTSRAQGFEDRIDPEDPHRSVSIRRATAVHG